MHCSNHNSQPSNSNTCGRFLLGRSGNSLRKKAKNPRLFRKNRPQLSPLKESVEPASTRLVVRSPQFSYSKSPIVTSETVHETGFSRAELFDLEESFKLFDVYGEGSVQVGDLKGILEVLQQEQSTSTYPHLDTLLERLSEVDDEDTLGLEDYVRLMASTTIGNSVAMQGGSQEEHFQRVFALFDSNNKGYIDLRDMEQIAIELGEHDMTRGELQEMMDRAVGSQKAEKVNVEDFTNMMTMSLFPSND